MSYRKLQPGECGYELTKTFKRLGIAHCDAYDHNDPGGCSNPACFKRVEFDIDKSEGDDMTENDIIDLKAVVSTLEDENYELRDRIGALEEDRREMSQVIEQLWDRLRDCELAIQLGDNP